MTRSRRPRAVPRRPPSPGMTPQRRVRPALRTSTRQAPEIVRGPGTTLYGQIEDWLAGEIAARGLSATARPGGPAAAAALQIAQDGQVYEIRRVRLADGRPIVLERSLFPAERFPGFLESRLDGSLYEVLEVRDGLRAHRATGSLEPGTAGGREAEALLVDVGAPLMQVERTAYARSGEPLEFARDLFRGDRTKLVVWTSELA